MPMYTQNMKMVCENCGSTIDNSSAKCPYCDYVRSINKVVKNKMPSTIEELKKWYDKANLPPYHVTRFYIGKNLKRKKVFGIYKDEKSCNYIAYKNKDNGERSIRYEGPNEKVAVREFYLRLVEEMKLQKANAKDSRKRKTIQNELRQLWLIPPALLLLLLLNLNTHTIKGEGYYQYNDNYYYYIGSWYEYKNGGWDAVNDSIVLGGLTENSGEYFKSKWYSSEYNIEKFPRKEYIDDSYYDTYTGSDSWDSSSSWDSSATDWSSDW